MKVAVLNLFRWKNILLLIYLQLLIKYVVFTSFNITTTLSLLHSIIYIFSVTFIMAAGYVINDVIDLKADLINKPTEVVVSKKISIETAKQFYKILNTLGILLGIFISFHLNKPTYVFYFLGASLLLYYYSKKLKSIPFIGNLSIALLISFSIFLPFLIDVKHNNYSQNYALVRNIIIGLGLFAFLINLAREILKDIIDINGDYTLNIKTLPILLGNKRTLYLIAVICSITVALLLFAVVVFASNYKLISLYLLFFSVLPLLYFSIKITKQKSLQKLRRMSLYLKLIMFFGCNSLLLIILYN